MSKDDVQIGLKGVFSGLSSSSSPPSVGGNQTPRSHPLYILIITSVSELGDNGTYFGGILCENVLRVEPVRIAENNYLAHQLCMACR